jgi:hypothetical protein
MLGFSSEIASARNRLPRAGAVSYFGDLRSPASQPRRSDSIGSLEMIIVRTLPHFWHSNVR